MTTTEYKTKLSCLIEQHFDNLENEPLSSIDSVIWLSNAIYSLTVEYYTSIGCSDD